VSNSTIPANYTRSNNGRPDNRLASWILTVICSAIRRQRLTGAQAVRGIESSRWRFAEKDGAMERESHSGEFLHYRKLLLAHTAAPIRSDLLATRRIRWLPG